MNVTAPCQYCGSYGDPRLAYQRARELTTANTALALDNARLMGGINKIKELCECDWGVSKYGYVTFHEAVVNIVLPITQLSQSPAQ